VLLDFGGTLADRRKEIMPVLGRRPDALVAILAATAGATDAISFLGLGGVFSSVMTANMVLLGLGAGQQNGSLALHAGAALAGYIVGAVAANRLTGPSAEPGNGWPTPVFAALVAEGIVLAGVTVGWEIVGGHPRGAVQVALLAGAAAAMGSQSAAVRALGIPEISSTYMTGMLTGILADLAAPAGHAIASRLRLLAMLIVGAIASGVTYTQAPRLAPLIPLALLACVIGIAARLRTRTADAGRSPRW
jgi:uncharacterized membrane protein YoaK (UPF0700 family)